VPVCSHGEKALHMVICMPLNRENRGGRSGREGGSITRRETTTDSKRGYREPGHFATSAWAGFRLR